MLYLNGRDLIKEQVPLYERKALLSYTFRPIPNYIESVDAALVDLQEEPNAVTERFELARYRQGHLNPGPHSSRFGSHFWKLHRWQHIWS